jgi:hypothetical protein
MPDIDGERLTVNQSVCAIRTLGLSPQLYFAAVGANRTAEG